MNWLKRGPEIKLSELRMPRFLVDLYYDLDERHLIPVVVILLAGIVALPIAFGHSSGSESEEAEAGVAAPAVPGGTVVAAATPGLHEYSHRLRQLRPKDPFKSPYAGKSETGAGGAAGEGAAASGAPTATVESPPVEVENPPPATGTSSGTGPAPRGEGSGGKGGGKDGSGGGGKGGGTSSGGQGSQPKPDSGQSYLSYTIDVRINPVSPGDGKPSDAKPYVRRGLPELTMLPSRDIPALTYMGPSGDAKKALMVVSSDVTSVFGDSRCVIGSRTCQLLALEPGAPETVVFGPHARTYRVQLLKLTPVESNGLDRAPLGKPKQSKQK